MVHEKKIFKNCPYCGVSVRDINFNHHLGKVHAISVDALHEEEDIQEEVAFIKDYVMRRSLENPPKNLQDLERMVEEADERWRTPPVPSPGSMGRFMRKHYKEFYRILEHAREKIDEMKIDLPPLVERNEFVEKAERTGGFKETVLEVEEKKLDLGGGNPDRWAFEIQFSILNLWKPGFEQYLTDLFFTKGRCANCRRRDKREVQCEEGYSECMFDDEFNQFKFDCVRRIVSQLKNGIESKELEIPKHLRDIEVRMRELSRGMRESHKRKE